MVKGQTYKSTARQFIDDIRKLRTLQDFQDSFSKNQPLGLLYQEMMNVKALDQALLSSYYKLINLQDAVQSEKIEIIEKARNSFIADFESQSRKPSPALKRFWQKFKNKLSSALNSFGQNKTPGIKTIGNTEKNLATTTIPIAPPLPGVEMASASKIRIKTSTPLRKAYNTKTASSKDLFSELLAKTAHRQKTETPAVSTANSDIKNQVKRSNKEITPQTQVNNQVAGIASPPPPPPLPDFKLQQKDTSKGKKNQSTQKSSTNDLLAQIREKGGSKNISKDHPNYKFVPISSKSQSSNLTFGDVFTKAMQNKKNIQSLGNSQVAELLDGKSDEERLNILYSAFIDKNNQLINDLKSYTINVSRSDDDDWDSFEETNSNTTTANLFTDAQFNAAKQAALETEQRIERGEDLMSLQPDIDKTTSQDVLDPAKAPTKSSEALDQISSHREALDKPQVIGEQSIQPTKMAPESRVAPGTIPPPPPVKSYATKHAPATFLDSIKNHSAQQLKPSVNTQHPLSTKDFTYLDKNKSDLEKDTGILAASLNTRRLSVDGNKELKKEFKNLDDQGKLNQLYSYIIDNNTAKIKAAINYDEEEKVFFKENLEKIAKDVLIVAKKNPQSAPQIRRGLQYLATKADLDISKIETISISHAEQIKQERDAPSKPRTH